MTKLLTTVATATIAAIAVTRATAEDSCVLVDFTAEKSEFASLNAAIDLVKAAHVVDSMFGEYDPLVLHDITLGEFSHSLLGQNLTIVPTIDSMNVTGLTTFAFDHVNVTSSNCVDVGVYSDAEVSVDATLSISLKELDATATAHVALALKKPSFTANIEANIYACAPGVSTTSCSNMTVVGIQTEVVSVSHGGSYSNILKEVLMKFKDASVQSFALDFSSVSTFDISFDSSSSVFSSITSLLTDYSANEINKKGDIYDTLISTCNDEVRLLLNDLIESKLKPQFGATCLSEN
ncbi:hypothetical protein KRP22_008107 [Phytophthora ramorum]|nr:hypothetical protein KRP22_3882 [Phytophthora ramorum]